MYFWAFTVIIIALAALWLFTLALRASLDTLENRLSAIEERFNRRLVLLEYDQRGSENKK